MRLLPLFFVLSACATTTTAVPEVPESEGHGMVLSEREMQIRAAVPQLKFASLGTPAAKFLASHPKCQLAPSDDGETQYCRLHVRFDALRSDDQCQDGCTWWHYTFLNDRLARIRMSREVFDSDQAYFDRFSDDARIIGEALERRYYEPVRIEQGEATKWADVEAMDHSGTDDGRLIFERRIYESHDTRVVWSLGGVPGHHPGAVMDVVVIGID